LSEKQINSLKGCLKYINNYKTKTALGEGAVLINKKGAIYIFLFILHVLLY